MPTPVATLQAQVDAFDAQITELAGAVQLHDGNTSASYATMLDLIAARNMTQALIDRLNGTKSLAVRGRVVGLPGGTSQGRYI